MPSQVGPAAAPGGTALRDGCSRPCRLGRWPPSRWQAGRRDGRGQHGEL